MRNRDSFLLMRIMRPWHNDNVTLGRLVNNHVRTRPLSSGKRISGERPISLCKRRHVRIISLAFSTARIRLRTSKYMPYAWHIRLLPSDTVLVSCGGAANFCWSQSGRSGSQENCMADSDCGQGGVVCVCGRRRQPLLLPAVKAALIDSQRKLMNPVTSLSPDPSSPFLRVAAMNLFLSVRSLSLCRSLSLFHLPDSSSPVSVCRTRINYSTCNLETAREQKSLFLYRCTRSGRSNDRFGTTKVSLRLYITRKHSLWYRISSRKWRKKKISRIMLSLSDVMSRSPFRYWRRKFFSNARKEIQRTNCQESVTCLSSSFSTIHYTKLDRSLVLVRPLYRLTVKERNNTYISWATISHATTTQY